MRTSQTCANLMAVIADIQHAIDPVVKNKEVKVEGERAKWSSTYATLGTLAKAITPHLKAHKIAKVQGVTGPSGAPMLTTRLQLGDEWLEADYPIKQTRDGSQGFGGGIGFAKRWAICGIFDIVPDDVEEAQGYKDARAETRVPRKGAAPGGLAAMLDAIRDAGTLGDFEKAARAARAAHPTGEPATSIERAITARFVTSADNADSEDKLAKCREARERIQPRGTEAREALARAERRMRGEV
jgi:hypothetical protein